MDMQPHVLPEAPAIPPAPAPKKNRRKKILRRVLGGAIVIVFGFIGVLSATHPGQPGIESYDQGGPCVNKASTIANVDLANAALKNAASAAGRHDLAGALAFVREASGHIRDAAHDVAADPSIASPLMAAADHYDAAADALDAGDTTTARSQLTLGDAAAERASAASGASTVRAC